MAAFGLASVTTDRVGRRGIIIFVLSSSHICALNRRREKLRVITVEFTTYSRKLVEAHYVRDVGDYPYIGCLGYRVSVRYLVYFRVISTIFSNVWYATLTYHALTETCRSRRRRPKNSPWKMRLNAGVRWVSDGATGSCTSWMPTTASSSWT